jgi:hypothetical protein
MIQPGVARHSVEKLQLGNIRSGRIKVVRNLPAGHNSRGLSAQTSTATKYRNLPNGLNA